MLEAMRLMLALAPVALLGLAQAQDREATPVILISIDTLRADHLSAYGYTRLTTPGIDSFAEHGTVFTEISSQIPLTLPSHTSLFTSTYPFENGIEENAEVLPSGMVTLASVLQSHGYKTAAFIGSNMLDRRFGLDSGFDDYDSPFGGSAAGGKPNPYSVRVRRDGALVARAANGWLASHREQPVFVFIHLFDLHTPYKLAPANGSNQPEAAGYDAELAYLDQILSRFRQSLAQNGWWRKSLVVLLSDHGESLGDHGELSHGYFIYQSTLHVPLIIHWPEGSPQRPERNSESAGLIDVAPTILDALHLAAPPSFAGATLLKADPARAVYSESLYARDSFRWAPLRSVRVGQRKYVDAPRAELFDLTEDPSEKFNILRANSAPAATLHSELTRLMAQHPRVQAIPAQDSSGAARTALGSLGYVSGGGARKTLFLDAPDPKDRLPEYQMFDRALDAMYSQRLDAAIRGFRQLLLLDPNNLPARGTLGDAYLRAGKSGEAVREWTAALASDPHYTPAAQALGEYYSSGQQWARARAYFQQALADLPGDSAIRFQLGVAERNLGMFKEGLENLHAACGANPAAACREQIREAEQGIKGETK